MQHRNQWLLTICLLSAAWLTGGCMHPMFRHETAPRETSVDFKGCRQFEAKIPNGTITIQGWDKSTVHLSAKVRAQGITPESAKRLAESTKIELKRIGDRVVVQYTPAIKLLQNETVHTDLSIHLPFEGGAAATTRFGDVSASKLHGPVEVRTSYGSITLTDLRGPVDCRTSHGSIKVARSQGSVRGRTSHGNIRLAEIKGPVDCRTSHGGISVIDPRSSVECSTSYGSIEVSLAAGHWTGHKIKLNTSHGNIKVKLVTQNKK